MRRRVNDARLPLDREVIRSDAERADIAIGCFAALCRDRLADHLLALSIAQPDASIGIHELALAELAPAVRAGRVALAVAPERAGAPAVAHALSAMTLWREQAMVAMATDHPLTAQAPLTPAALLDTMLLLSTDRADSEMQRYLLGRLFPGKRPPANAAPQRGDALLARAAAGEGVALVLAGQRLPPGVVARPVAGAGSFAVQAWWRTDDRSAALTALLRLLGGGPA